jgi:radical SAM protein with 4Fe4S-binding SPASM domain
MPEIYNNNHPCFAPWAHALIDRVGRVSVCCMMPNQPIIGDLRQQSFKEIWTGEKFAALRQTQNSPRWETCQKCDMFLENNRRLAEILYS